MLMPYINRRKFCRRRWKHCNVVAINPMPYFLVQILSSLLSWNIKISVLLKSCLFYAVYSLQVEVAWRLLAVKYLGAAIQHRTDQKRNAFPRSRHNSFGPLGIQGSHWCHGSGGLANQRTESAIVIRKECPHVHPIQWGADPEHVGGGTESSNHKKFFFLSSNQQRCCLSLNKKRDA